MPESVDEVAEDVEEDDDDAELAPDEADGAEQANELMLPFVVAAVEHEFEMLLLKDDGIVGMVLQLFDVVVPDEDDDGVDIVAEVLTESVVAEDEADEEAVEFAARSRPPVFCCCSLCSLKVNRNTG